LRGELEAEKAKTRENTEKLEAVAPLIPIV
jgi:hypothetical protein